MLMSDRVDFIVEDQSVLNYWTKHLGISDEIEISGVDSEVAFYPAYRNNDKEAAILAAKIDRGIEAVRNNKPFMNQLIKKYKIAVWK